MIVGLVRCDVTDRFATGEPVNVTGEPSFANRKPMGKPIDEPVTRKREEITINNSGHWATISRVFSCMVGGAGDADLHVKNITDCCCCCFSIAC